MYLHTYVRAGLLGVAKWQIFKLKIPIWVNFEGSCNGRCWYILWSFGLFCGNFVYFVALWYILWSFGIYFPVLVCCTKKNLATLGLPGPPVSAEKKFKMESVLWVGRCFVPSLQLAFFALPIRVTRCVLEKKSPKM
jgi:hypothetical protein